MKLKAIFAEINTTEAVVTRPEPTINPQRPEFFSGLTFTTA